MDVAFGRAQTVLEIGAGTGATTSYLLPLLEQRQAKYAFTDVSPLFHAAAKQKFSRYNFVEYELLDIQQSRGDGMAAPGRSFDFVVASNVLHAARDIRVALRNVAALLKPADGCCCWRQQPSNRRMNRTGCTLTSAGLLPGWWNFVDVELRPGGPLLRQAQWIRGA